MAHRRQYHCITIRRTRRTRRRRRGKGLVRDVLTAAAQPIKQRIKKAVQPAIRQAKTVAKLVTAPYQLMKTVSPYRLLKTLITAHPKVIY